MLYIIQLSLFRRTRC